MIETSQLTKHYGSTAAVDDLDIYVEEQEIFGMLGPNGAGKTTTVKMLTTLLRPTHGSARVGGFDIVRDRDQVRRIIGYLPQQLTSDDTLTGYENVLFYAKLYHIPRSLRRERIGEALRLVGLDEYANQMVSSYSGGMKRRLELASVLVSRPRLLFLDEPTLGLDPGSRKIIWDFLIKLRDTFATTIFLTTNYMDEADRLCDRVAIIDMGRHVITGSPAGLKESVGDEVIGLKMSTEDDRIAEIARSLPYVRLVEHAGASVKLVVEGRTGEKTIPLLLADLEAKGLEVFSVTMEKPSLDDVFVRYTGKAFAEAPMSGPKRMQQKALLLRAMRL